LRAIVAITSAAFIASSGGSSLAAKPGCDGLLAFTSNRSEDALPEIYRIGLDGTRTDVSRSIGTDTWPTPSPDGTKVAFWSSVDGLVVADADGGNRRRLVPVGAASSDYGEIAWSPDSRRLAVTDSELSHDSAVPLVVVFDTVTGNDTILDGGTNPHWSPDGTLLEWTDPTGQQVLVARSDRTDERRIASGRFVAWSPDGTRLMLGSEVVPVGGGSPIEISGFNALAWTPDGSRIIGTTLTEAGLRLESVAADGTDPRVIAENLSGGFVRLSPDGRLLLYATAGAGSVITDLDGRLVQSLGKWPGTPNAVWDPLWSPDSRHVLLWSKGEVVVDDITTGAALTLAGAPDESETTDRPVWSADGSSVYDSITDASGNTDLYLARSDGTAQRRIVTDPVPDVYPAWSPNGKQLAFIRYGAPPSLVVTDTAGQTRTLLSDRALAKPGQSAPLPLIQTGLGPPSWSPDGKTIAVASTSGLAYIDVRRRTAHRTGPVHIDYPTFSPDGTRIAYATTNLTGGENLVVAPLGAGGPKRWSVHAGEVSNTEDDEPGLIEDISWSANGNLIFFTRFGVGKYGPFGYQQRTYDTRTHRLLYKWPDQMHAADSPDGRFYVDAGFTTTITRAKDGTRMATLKGLRAVEVAWQPLCKTDKASSR
jgi:TolB protein